MILSLFIFLILHVRDLENRKVEFDDHDALPIINDIRKGTSFRELPSFYWDRAPILGRGQLFLGWSKGVSKLFIGTKKGARSYSLLQQ